MLRPRLQILLNVIVFLSIVFQYPQAPKHILKGTVGAFPGLHNAVDGLTQVLQVLDGLVRRSRGRALGV